MSDPFGTAAVRARVLDAWAAAPVRFREDANAEEELALGAYRDRVVVELAQNAADAAARAGVPGRLLLRLDGGVLVAANTGAPLDHAGVQALATLRASAKRGEETAGHFGVGFSAVLAVTDAPEVRSRSGSGSGGVRFSAEESRRLVEGLGVPGLAAELAARNGHVPVLRLPFAADGPVPDGYTTAVVLPLRDEAAAAVVARELAETGDALLLALPALAEIVVETPAGSRRHADAGARWHIVRRGGRLRADQLADRPTEERERTAWQVTWALPVELPRDGKGERIGVLHAPTPSEEPLGWPALLVASFPMDSGRRHVERGPATDALVAEAAAGYAELLAGRAAAGDPVWPLVPTGLPAGPLDAAIREAVTALLPGTPLLAPAAGGGDLLPPRDAVAVEPPAGVDARVVAALSRFVPNLVLAPRSGRAVLEALGVTRVPLADVVDELPAGGEPAGWAALYDAVDGLAADPSARESLAALPVPLADGRTVRGARGAVLADDDVAGPLGVLGVRIVDPAAAHPLLERLGARPVDARQALDLPEVRAAVARSADGPPLADDPEDEADAVLGLVAAALREGPLEAGDRPWLAELELPDTDGEPTPAYALVLPGRPAADWFDPDEIGVVDPELLARWGADVLAAVGVLDGLGLLRASDLRLADDEDIDPDGPGDATDPSALPGWDDWVADVLAVTRRAGGEDDAWLPELAAVRDLDLVRNDAWAAVLAAIDADPALRAAVVEPARVLVAGRTVAVPSYSAWWLRHRLAGGAGAVAPADGDPVLVAALPPEPPAWRGLSPALRRALGVTGELAALGPAAVPAVLARLGFDEDPQPDAAGLLRLWRRVAELAAGAGADPPDRLRVPDGEGTALVDADQVLVVDSPMHLQRGDLGPALPVPAGLGSALADLLDVRYGADVPGVVAETGDAAGVRTATPPVVRHLVPDAPAHWCEHEQLLVDGIEVDWWVDEHETAAAGGEPLVHAATLDGLARGVAWRCGVWDRRLVVGQALIEPETVPDLLLDEAVSAVG